MNECRKKGQKKRNIFGSPFSINHAHHCNSIGTVPRHTDHFMPTHIDIESGAHNNSAFYSLPAKAYRKMSNAVRCPFSPTVRFSGVVVVVAAVFGHRFSVRSALSSIVECRTFKNEFVKLIKSANEAKFHFDSRE